MLRGDKLGSPGRPPPPGTSAPGTSLRSGRGQGGQPGCRPLFVLCPGPPAQPCSGRFPVLHSDTQQVSPRSPEPPFLLRKGLRAPAKPGRPRSAPARPWAALSSFLGSSPPAARPWGCAGLSGRRVGNPARQREQPCRVFACLRRHRREAPCGHAGPPAGTRLGERGELPVAPGGRPRGQAAKRGGLPRLETGTRSGNSGSTAARTRTICSGQSGAPRGPVPGCGARGGGWAGAGRPQRPWVPPSLHGVAAVRPVQAPQLHPGRPSWFPVLPSTVTVKRLL